MAVVRIQLGLANYAGEPFFVVHEWVANIAVGPPWQANAPALNLPIERMAASHVFHEIMIRVVEVVPEPHDDVDLMFYERGLHAERSRLFQRVRRATDNDLFALVFRLAMEFDDTEKLHQYLDVLGVDRGE
jgi:hypothetical protein